MRRNIQELAFRQATAVSLKDLFRFGADQRPQQRLRNAQFLHKELPIRLAQRVQELNSLPYGLSMQPQILSVQQWYKEYFDLLVNSPRPETIADDAGFTELLKTILQDHNEVIQTMALGVIELQQRLGDRPYTDMMAHRVDNSLNRFFMARIGLRFLISHHITSQVSAKGWSGIIEEACSPRQVCEMAADDAQYLCELSVGRAPEVGAVVNSPLATADYR